MSRVVFIERDGALIVRPPDENVTLQNLRLLPDVVPALKTLRTAGYELVMVAKQDNATDFLRELFASQGAAFEAVVGTSDADIRIDGSRAAEEFDPLSPWVTGFLDFVADWVRDEDGSGAIGFVWRWYDDNTMTRRTGRLTSWGRLYFDRYIRQVPGRH